MPLDRLAVFLSEIEPLEAQEKLSALNVLRLSQAGKDDNQARMVLIGWENQAKRIATIEQTEEKKMSKSEYFAMLKATGVRLV